MLSSYIFVLTAYNIYNCWNT